MFQSQIIFHFQLYVKYLLVYRLNAIEKYGNEFCAFYLFLDLFPIPATLLRIYMRILWSKYCHIFLIFPHARHGKIITVCAPFSVSLLLCVFEVFVEHTHTHTIIIIFQRIIYVWNVYFSSSFFVSFFPCSCACFSEFELKHFGNILALSMLHGFVFCRILIVLWVCYCMRLQAAVLQVKFQPRTILFLPLFFIVAFVAIADDVLFGWNVAFFLYFFFFQPKP